LGQRGHVSEWGGAWSPPSLITAPAYGDTAGG